MRSVSFQAVIPVSSDLLHLRESTLLNTSYPEPQLIYNEVWSLSGSFDCVSGHGDRILHEVNLFIYIGQLINLLNKKIQSTNIDQFFLSFLSEVEVDGDVCVSELSLHSREGNTLIEPACGSTVPPWVEADRIRKAKAPGPVAHAEVDSAGAERASLSGEDRMLRFTYSAESILYLQVFFFSTSPGAAV